ncbi:nucleotidyltransferase substrate binding protein [bacterium]|nr:nucleotidyltransferase substrate binding protein [bacterium]
MIKTENLENAYKTLLECYNDYLANQDSVLLQYIADSCVKRFEYTLETAWKLAKKIFIQKYGKTELELTINNIFRFMQGYGYAQNWESWRDYYQKRNNTAHEYSLEKSRQLMEIIPNFMKDVEFFLEKLQEEN